MLQKIAFFELEGWEEKIIREAFPNEDLYLSQTKVTSLCLPETNEFEIVSVFVDSKIDQTVFEYFPKVRCIATRSTGYDHIDLKTAQSKSVSILYVPAYGTHTVAEFTFGLILNLTRKLYQSIDQVKETGSFSLKGLRGNDLKGKTLGIVGTGRIGKEVARIAKCFEMKVIAYDPRPDQDFAKTAGVSYVTLEDLLSTVDIVSLHCPLNKDTHYLINQKNISLIKKGAYLINTARGPVVETEALISALKDGYLAGAALDVLEEEGETKDELDILAFGHPKEEELRTMLENHILMKMPNVLVTPHNAFNSHEALERILRTTIENIQSYLAGAPQNIAK